MNDGFIIRDLTAADARDVRRLLEQLGYLWTVAELAARVPAFLASGERAFVATPSEDLSPPLLLGVLTLHITPVLHRAGSVGRLTMLVVDKHVRRMGIGRALVNSAEKYFSERGCVLIEVTSNKRRTDAHAFYERLGYTATSERFAKTIAP